MNQNEWAIPEKFCPPPIEEVGFPDFFDKIEPWISRLFFDKNVCFHSHFQKKIRICAKNPNFLIKMSPQSGFPGKKL